MDLSGLLRGIEWAPSFSRLREAVTAERGLVIGVGDAAKAAAIAVLAGGARGAVNVAPPGGGPPGGARGGAPPPPSPPRLTQGSRWWSAPARPAAGAGS